MRGVFFWQQKKRKRSSSTAIDFVLLSRSGEEEIEQDAKTEVHSNIGGDVVRPLFQPREQFTAYADHQDDDHPYEVAVPDDAVHRWVGRVAHEHENASHSVRHVKNFSEPLDPYWHAPYHMAKACNSSCGDSGWCVTKPASHMLEDKLNDHAPAQWGPEEVQHEHRSAYC